MKMARHTDALPAAQPTASKHWRQKWQQQQISKCFGLCHDILKVVRCTTVAESIEKYCIRGKMKLKCVNAINISKRKGKWNRQDLLQTVWECLLMLPSTHSRRQTWAIRLQICQFTWNTCSFIFSSVMMKKTVEMTKYIGWITMTLYP